MITYLLDAGTEIDATNAAGYTPLCTTVVASQCDAARLLLERGAEPCTVSADGTTTLAYAAASGTGLVRELIGRGCDVNTVNAKGQSALMIAAITGRDGDVIAALIEAGAIGRLAIAISGPRRVY